LVLYIVPHKHQGQKKGESGVTVPLIVLWGWVKMGDA
jgi:hypothetical protein